MAKTSLDIFEIGGASNSFSDFENSIFRAIDSIKEYFDVEYADMIQEKMMNADYFFVHRTNFAKAQDEYVAKSQQVLEEIFGCAKINDSPKKLEIVLDIVNLFYQTREESNRFTFPYKFLHALNSHSSAYKDVFEELYLSQFNDRQSYKAGMDDLNNYFANKILVNYYKITAQLATKLEQVKSILIENEAELNNLKLKYNASRNTNFMAHFNYYNSRLIPILQQYFGNHFVDCLSRSADLNNNIDYELTYLLSNYNLYKKGTNNYYISESVLKLAFYLTGNNYQNMEQLQQDTSFFATLDRAIGEHANVIENSHNPLEEYATANYSKISRHLQEKYNIDGNVGLDYLLNSLNDYRTINSNFSNAAAYYSPYVTSKLNTMTVVSCPYNYDDETLTHELLHLVSAHGTNTGFHVNGQYTALNEAFTEYFTLDITGFKFKDYTTHKFNAYTTSFPLLHQMLNQKDANNNTILNKIKKYYITNNIYAIQNYIDSNNFAYLAQILAKLDQFSKENNTTAAATSYYLSNDMRALSMFLPDEKKCNEFKNLINNLAYICNNIVKSVQTTTNFQV